MDNQTCAIVVVVYQIQKCNSNIVAESTYFPVLVQVHNELILFAGKFCNHNMKTPASEAVVASMAAVEEVYKYGSSWVKPYLA